MIKHIPEAVLESDHSRRLSPGGAISYVRKALLMQEDPGYT